MKEFADKYGPWAIIAGASEGLGAAYSHSLAKRGLNLILIARRPEPLQEIRAVLKSKYLIKVETISLDLGQGKILKKVLESLNQDIGLLVYNAALAPIGYFETVAQDAILGH